MSGGIQVWQFDVIEALADQLRGVHAAVQATNDAIRGDLGVLAELWGGASSGQYQALQQLWNVKSENNNTAFLQFSAAITQATGHMRSTEAIVGNLFAG